MGAQHDHGWERWPEGAPELTLGVEEEVMFVAAPGYNLAQAIDEVLPRLPQDVAKRCVPETHAAALEIASGVHKTVSGAIGEMHSLRTAIRETCEPLELRVASAGTHPFAVSREVVVSRGARQTAVYGSMRELARREPTFALHVHVGFGDAETAVSVFNRMRCHVPLLLALSANSPFWQGRDTGLSSSRTPLFQAFPRVGLPRRFESFGEWLDMARLLIGCEAFPEPTYMWWDIRIQPIHGTIEIRIMDAQITLEATAALVALVQCLAKLERDEAFSEERSRKAPEVDQENRFLAARDGTDAELIDPVARRRVPLRAILDDLLPRLEPHAEELGCEAEFGLVDKLYDEPGELFQLRVARRPQRLPGLVEAMAAEFC